MGRRRRCHRGPPSPMPFICMAFGAGILLSMFFSLKLVVFLAAVFLVILGFNAAGR